MSIILKSGSLEAFFSEKNGALTGMKSLKTGWIIHRREELGLSFRLLVPVHDELRNNPVFGEKQKLASYTANDREVKFRWNGVESERAGKIDVNVEITVRVEDEQKTTVRMWLKALTVRISVILQSRPTPSGLKRISTHTTPVRSGISGRSAGSTRAITGRIILPFMEDRTHAEHQSARGF